MNQFLINSLIASVILTLALNLIPRLFPNASQRAAEKMREAMEEQAREVEQGNRPRVRVFFPWKTMLLISVVLTIFANIATRL